MEFRLLGAVAASVDGQPVDLGPARRRAVLVALLVDANLPVPVDQLVDRVWADSRPPRVRDALYSYLSRLRQTLAPAVGVELRRQSGGYVLTTDPANVDLWRFRQLALRARSTDGAHALSLFDDALGQWRGSAVADLDNPWLDALREKLHRERLGVELDRNDLALRHGQHARLLPELSALAGAHPLDERLVGQLILALYLCGRQADALTYYEKTRRLLAEDLGTDPSPPLQALHQQIIMADQALATVEPARPAPGPAPAAPSIPRQLPATPPLFAGRVEELKQLTAALDRASASGTLAISVIGGTGGIGKTWLALRWAHDNADRFPDGQLYVNLRGFDPSGSPVPPATALRTCLGALGVPPNSIPVDPDSQASLYRSLVARRSMLIVLDNARDADQVRPLLPGAASCVVIVTSRRQLPGLVTTDGAHYLALDLLTPDEARRLLALRLDADRLAAEPDAVAGIIATCAGLPLALSIVAARAAMNPAIALSALGEDLASGRHGLGAFAGSDPAADVRAVFSWSYHALSVEAARMFRLLGLTAGPDVSVAAAASLAGISTLAARSLLDELTQAYLLTAPSPGRYAFHDLLRAYAGELARDDHDQRVALGRMFDHYLHAAYDAALLIEPRREPIDLSPPGPGVAPQDLADAARALDWFIAERPVLLAAVELASRTGFDGHAWRLAWSLTTFLCRRSHWPDLAAAQQVALAAATRAADQTGQAHAHRALALACNQLGQEADAIRHLRHAAALFTALDDLPGQAYTYLSFGWVYEWQGNQREALSFDQQALHLFRAAGHKVGQALALNAVGWGYAHAGDYQRAIRYCEQALTLHEALGNPTGAARTWDSLGYAHHRLGHHQQAVTCFHQALEIYRQAGDHYTEGETLTHLGDTYHAMRDFRAAEDAWRCALERFGDDNPTDSEKVLTRLRRLNDSGQGES